MVMIPIPSTDNETNQVLNGIGRGNYVISIIGLALLAGVSYVITNSAIWGYIYGVVLALFPTYLRLKNLEWSNWLLFLVFVPGINLVFAFVLVILPENYAVTHKLDRDAKMILIWGGLFFLLMSLFFGSIYYRTWRNSQPVKQLHLNDR